MISGFWVFGLLPPGPGPVPARRPRPAGGGVRPDPCCIFLYNSGPARPGPGRRGPPGGGRGLNHMKKSRCRINLGMDFLWLLRKAPFIVRSARFAFHIRIVLRRGGCLECKIDVISPPIRRRSKNQAPPRTHGLEAACPPRGEITDLRHQ